jgi:hypothetical protein
MFCTELTYYLCLTTYTYTTHVDNFFVQKLEHLYKTIVCLKKITLATKLKDNGNR